MNAGMNCAISVRPSSRGLLNEDEGCHGDLWPGGEQAKRSPRRDGARRGARGRSAGPSSLARGVGFAVAEESGCPLARLDRALAASRRFERFFPELRRHQVLELELLDRKSTRLNSSH